MMPLGCYNRDFDLSVINNRETKSSFQQGNDMVRFLKDVLAIRRMTWEA